MKKNNVERILSEAVSSVTPNDVGAVLSACQPRGEVIQMNEYKTEARSGKNTGWAKKLIATAAAVALIIGCSVGFGAYQKANAVGAIVSVDAGSAVSLKVNSKDVVVDVDENEFGIEKADVKGMSVTDATREVVAAMAAAGDITEEDNIVLLSVEKLGEKAKEIADKIGDATRDAGEETGDADSALNFEIADVIKDALKQAGIDATVIDQEFSATETIQKLSEKLGITAGKTSFIDKILGTTEDENTQMSDLATQSISAIIKYAADYLSGSGVTTDVTLDPEALNGGIGPAIKGAMNEGINVGIDGKAKVGIKSGEDGSFDANIEIDGKANVGISTTEDGNFALGVEVDGTNYTFDSADPANSIVGLIESLIKTIK